MQEKEKERAREKTSKTKQQNISRRLMGNANHRLHVHATNNNCEEVEFDADNESEKERKGTIFFRKRVRDTRRPTNQGIISKSALREKKGKNNVCKANTVASAINTSLAS